MIIYALVVFKKCINIEIKTTTNENIIKLISFITNIKFTEKLFL